MADDGPDDGGGLFANTGFLTAIWVCALLVFMIAPCCVSRYRRRLWLARLTMCKWQVDVEPEAESELDRIARERYEAYLAMAAALAAESKQLTKEEEEEIRQLFLLERMADFTVALRKEDIRHKDDIETDEIDANAKSMHNVDHDASAAKVVCQVESSESEIPSDDVEKGIKTNATEATSDSDDENGSGNESSDDDVLAQIEGESNSYVLVPIHGQPFAPEGITRLVPNGCAICLCEFEADDRVSWSATSGDPHVFHEDCMMRYLLSVGAKAGSRRRQSLLDAEAVEDPVKAAVDFPMLCPCCRQTFVNKDPKERPRLLTATTETDNGDEESGETNDRDTVTDNPVSETDVETTIDSTRLDSPV